MIFRAFHAVYSNLQIIPNKTFVFTGLILAEIKVIPFSLMI